MFTQQSDVPLSPDITHPLGFAQVQCFLNHTSWWANGIVRYSDWCYHVCSWISRLFHSVQEPGNCHCVQLLWYDPTDEVSTVMDAVGGSGNGKPVVAADLDGFFTGSGNGFTTRHISWSSQNMGIRPHLESVSVVCMLVSSLRISQIVIWYV